MQFRVKYKLLGHLGAIYKLLAIDDKKFISLGGDGYVVEWQKSNVPQDGKLIAVDTSPIYTGHLDLNKSLLYIGKLDGNISILNLYTKEIFKSYKAHSKSVYCLAEVDEYILSGGGDGCICFYNKSMSKVEKSIQLTTSALRTLLIIGKEVLAGASDGHLYSLDLVNWDIKRTKIGDLSLFTLCPMENKLLIGGRDSKIFEINCLDKKIVRTVDAHRATINHIITIEDLVISACRDKSIRIWTKEMALIQSLGPIQGGHINSVNGLLPGTHQNTFYSCSDDKSIAYWSLE